MALNYVHHQTPYNEFDTEEEAWDFLLRHITGFYVHTITSGYKLKEPYEVYWRAYPAVYAMDEFSGPARYRGYARFSIRLADV